MQICWSKSYVFYIIHYNIKTIYGFQTKLIHFRDTKVQANYSSKWLTKTECLWIFNHAVHQIKRSFADQQIVVGCTFKYHMQMCLYQTRFMNILLVFMEMEIHAISNEVLCPSQQSIEKRVLNCLWYLYILHISHQLHCFLFLFIRKLLSLITELSRRSVYLQVVQEPNKLAPRLTTVT